MSTDGPGGTDGTGSGSGTSPVWDRASLPSGIAIARATRVTAAATVVGGLLALAGGWPWAVSVLLGGGIVLGVLWGSATVLIAGARRVAPPAALLLALGLYIVVVVGLFVLAVVARPAADSDGPLHPAGVGAGIVGVVACWTVSLLVVHVRHDRTPRARRSR